jgi:hypothetical protein
VDAVVPLHRSWSLREDPTPFSIVRSALPVRRAGKAQLLSVAAHLEEQAVAWSDGPVVLSTFQTDEELDVRTHERYAQLAGRGSFVAAMRSGGELTVATASARRSCPTGIGLGEEWSVVVVGRTTPARWWPDRWGGPRGGLRLRRHALPELVVEAGRSLLRHVAPAGEEVPAPLR